MQLIDAKQAAQILQVRKARLYELVRLGMIPSVRLGQRQVRFDLDALAAWSKSGGSVEQPLTASEAHNGKG